MAAELFQMLIFPGLLFLAAFGLAAEYLDRKLAARLQNRVGPPWFQPLADLIKLASKEEIVPNHAAVRTFRLAPVVALAAAASAFFYIPLWSSEPAMKFEGDVIVVLYLLTIPTMTFFLGGWYSRSVYSMIGAARSIMQIFAYEIPLFLCILGPALLAGTWSLSDMAVFYQQHPALAAVNAVGLCLALVTMLGKLERVPFDIPEAETEIVAGSFTEYSGRLLAMFRLAIDIEAVVCASLVVAVFVPFGMSLPAPLAFALYVVKVLAVVAVLAVLRTVFARLRIDQMINLCWMVIAPIAFGQVMLNLIVKGLRQ